MAQESTSLKSRTNNRLSEPERYAVVFHNDDFTPMEFVTELLRKVFFKTYEEAEMLMLTVHHEGKAVVGVYSYDIATSKAAKATKSAREEGYPLEISVEKEIDTCDLPF